MADLREAAEAVVDNPMKLDGEGAVVCTRKLQLLRAALAAPDPVAEAREIIGGLILHIDPYGCWHAKGELCARARDWLKRNGG